MLLVNSVKLRPNHYETLELTPTATGAQIAEAFEKKVGLLRAHPLSAFAQVCLAYETLRNPIKRREYDRVLGVQPEVKQMTFAVSQPRWEPLIASPKAPGQPAMDASALSQSPARAECEPDASVHPRVAAIAASLRELAKPAGPDSDSNFTTQTVAKHAPKHLPENRVDELVEHIRTVGRAEKERLHDVEHRLLDWKRPAFAAGALILGASLVGVLAGVSVQSAPDSVRPSTPSHESKTRDALPTPVEVQPGTQVSADLPLSKTRHLFSRKQRASMFEREIVASLPASNPPPGTDTSPSDQIVTEPVQTVAATMPLSSDVIARTIERIGYSCGTVASTAAVDERRRGIFEVTCTSGDSYQATPVGGRYHFRRVRHG